MKLREKKRGRINEEVMTVCGKQILTMLTKDRVKKEGFGWLGSL